MEIKQNSSQTTVKRILKLVFKYKISVIAVLMMSVLEALILVLSPKFAGKGITALGVKDAFGNPNVNLEYIFNILAFLLILYSLNGLTSCLGRYFFTNTSVKVVSDLRNKISEKMSKISVSYLQGKQKGDVISCIVNDAEVLSSSFIESVRSLISSIIIAFGTVYMMISISWEMSLCTFLIFPFMIILIFMIAAKSQKYYVNYREDFGKMSGHIEESLSGYETLKAFNAESEFVNNFDEINSILCKESFKSEFLSGLMAPVMTFLSKFIYVICCVVGGYLAVVRGLTIGDITAFIAYSDQFFKPFMDISSIFGSFQASFAAASRIFSFLDAPEEEFVGEDFTKSEGSIEFKNVSFGYEKEKLVLKNISFKIAAGEKVAIVGKTGSGKTTISNLLMRFYEDFSGEILLGGKNIKEINLESYRKNFAVVTQDSWIYSSEIKENIRYGNLSASDEEVEFSAEKVGLGDFISSFPDGYATKIEEGSSNISEGQKQLVCIARAVVSNRDIFIMDEATASVDTLTEEKIQNFLSKFLFGKTAIIIAHRLSTIKNSDKILVIDNGELVECGTHDQLMRKHGKYYEMYFSGLN